MNKFEQIKSMGIDENVALKLIHLFSESYMAGVACGKFLSDTGQTKEEIARNAATFHVVDFMHHPFISTHVQPEQVKGYYKF